MPAADGPGPQGDEQVAGLLPRPLVGVHHDAGPLDQRRVHLPRGRSEGADGIDVSARLHVAPAEDGSRRGRGAGDQTGLADRGRPIARDLHIEGQRLPHAPGEAAGPLRAAPDHEDTREGAHDPKAAQLEGRLDAGAEAGDAPDLARGEQPRGERGGGARADRGEEGPVHQRQRRAGARIGEEIAGVDGRQAQPPVLRHHGDELGAQRAPAREGRDHREEDPTSRHGQGRARQGLGPAGRALAEGALDGPDHVGRGEEPLQIPAREDEHQPRAPLRLIIRLMSASRTTSPRWFVTRWR